MELHTVEPCGNSADGSRRVGVQDLFDLRVRELLGCHCPGPFAQRHLARPDRVPGGVRVEGGLHLRKRIPPDPGVPELDPELGTVGVDSVRDATQGFDVAVVEELADGERSSQRRLVDMGGTHQDESHAALGALGVVVDGHVGEYAI